MINGINKISPGIRDKSLNRNIGKYSQIKEMLSTPIGEFVDIYNSTSDYLSSKSPNGLLYYTNDKSFLNKKGDLAESFEPKYFKYRDNNPINIDYPNDVDQKYYYADGMGYHDETTGSQISSVVSNIAGIIYGDGVTLDFSDGKVAIDSASLETATSLANRIIEETTYNKTTLGTIGLKKLGTTLLNATIQNTSNQIARNLFYKRPLHEEKDYAQIDTDILEMIPGKNSKLFQKVLPIYFYKQVRENTLGLSQDVSVGKTWVNGGEDVFEYSIDDHNITVHYNVKDLKLNKDSLLYKTSQMFRSGKIETLITNTQQKIDGDKLISKGRALKKKDSNEFSRTWTALNQYNRISSLIRPLDDKNYNILKENLKRVRPNSDNFTNNTVLQRDGFVKIAPYKSDSFIDPKVDNKKYMFSIENLAWKDYVDSTIKGTSQEGPNGGRIMWFPPYDISINENTNVNWNSETFIGRGEPVKTYVDTTRTATLQFTLLVDHPSIINYYKQEKGQELEDDDYLRLFAGDDIINLGSKTNDEKDVKDKPKKVEEKSENKLKTLSFKVYFPNNLSGIDYINNPSEIMKYLYKGESYTTIGDGAGYEMEGSLNEDDDKPTAEYGEFCYIVDLKYKGQTLEYEGNYKSTSTDKLNQKSDSTAENQHSFKEIYEALNKINDNDEIFDTIKNAKRVDIVGASSKQGVEKFNNELSNNRAKVVSAWIKTFNKGVNPTINDAYNSNTETSNINANDITNKKDRFVKVIFTSDPNDIDIEENLNNEGYTVVKTQISETESEGDSSNTAYRVKKSMYGNYHDRNEPDNDEIKRLNDESAFFESIGLSGSEGLNHEKNIIMNKLSEKIKYFHPAFHSSTPEGFNSRLTFLQQCTRQGPTSELSSTNNTKNSATNMAFGRPPVCILRLGDFYNTKITIDSLTVSYDPLVWDLNEEGVGVQPMLAKITLNFTFIGGSDLTGDIARLQNAVTFNYFANTGVYDDRNDSVISNRDSDDNNTKKYRTLYNPGVYDPKE